MGSHASELVSAVMEKLEVLKPCSCGLIYSVMILYAFIDCTSYGAELHKLFLDLHQRWLRGWSTSSMKTG